jgi:hypothetical protein
LWGWFLFRRSIGFEERFAGILKPVSGKTFRCCLIVVLDKLKNAADTLVNFR